MPYLDKEGVRYLWRKITARLAGKQDQLTGAIGQIVGFSQSGTPEAQHAHFTVLGDGNPVGAVISFIGKSAPPNYLVCDGTVKNVADYPELSDFFRVQFGSVSYFGGNGTTTFAVPDMRNLFLRGYHGSTTALSGELGKRQEATIIPYDISTSTSWNRPIGDRNGNSSPQNYDTRTPITYRGVWYANGYDGDSSNGYSGYTPRPVNMSVLYCVKAVPTEVTMESINAAIQAAIQAAI